MVAGLANHEINGLPSLLQFVSMKSSLYFTTCFAEFQLLNDNISISIHLEQLQGKERGARFIGALPLFSL